MAWVPLHTEDAVEHLMTRFGAFHDACLREASLATETYIDEGGGFHDSGGLDTSIVLVFQSQSALERAIEVRCTGVTHFWIRPTPDNADSILAGASFGPTDTGCRLGLYFIGLPMTGAPNSWAHRRVEADEAPAIDIGAAAMAWRPVPEALGAVLRHRRSDG